MALGMETRFNLKDGQKTITFLGWELGAATSLTEESVRWTELSLYRTTAGAYILQKVGRSDVFHSEDCDRRDRNGKPKSKGKRYELLEHALPEGSEDDYCEDWFVPCEECRPEFEVTPAWVERDIYSAPVFSTPELAIGALYQSKGPNKFLSRIARELLDQAVAKDPAVAYVVDQPVHID